MRSDNRNCPSVSRTLSFLSRTTVHLGACPQSVSVGLSRSSRGLVIPVGYPSELGFQVSASIPSSLLTRLCVSLGRKSLPDDRESPGLHLVACLDTSAHTTAQLWCFGWCLVGCVGLAHQRARAALRPTKRAKRKPIEKKEQQFN